MSSRSCWGSSPPSLQTRRAVFGGFCLKNRGGLSSLPRLNFVFYSGQGKMRMTGLVLHSTELHYDQKKYSSRQYRCRSVGPVINSFESWFRQDLEGVEKVLSTSRIPGFHPSCSIKYMLCQFIYVPKYANRVPGRQHQSRKARSSAKCITLI